VSKTEREWVREAIQRLPAASREIILLREYEELSYQEIAHILDCPPGTVMSRLARARSRLRTLLTSPAGVDPIDSTEDTSERAGTADHQDDHFSLR
jgi:RNA polymerase sigma-70 factor (ECF subfamily)